MSDRKNMTFINFSLAGQLMFAMGRRLTGGYVTALGGKRTSRCPAAKA